MSYEPKLHHAILTTLFSALFAYLWAVTQEKVSTAFGWIALVFLGMTIVLLWLLAESSHYWSVTRYIEALVKIDPDLRNALALRVPALRLVATRGRVQTLFEDTHVSAEHFRLFLTDSDREHTVAERNWISSDRPRWAWKEIYDWCIRNRKVIPDSASGSHSYQWVGTAHQNLCVYYLNKPVYEINEDTRVFAEEEEWTRSTKD